MARHRPARRRSAGPGRRSSAAAAARSASAGGRSRVAAPRPGSTLAAEADEAPAGQAACSLRRSADAARRPGAPASGSPPAARGSAVFVEAGRAVAAAPAPSGGRPSRDRPGRGRGRRCGSARPRASHELVSCFRRAQEPSTVGDVARRARTPRRAIANASGWCIRLICMQPTSMLRSPAALQPLDMGDRLGLAGEVAAVAGIVDRPGPGRHGAPAAVVAPGLAGGHRGQQAGRQRAGRLAARDRLGAQLAVGRARRGQAGGQSAQHGNQDPAQPHIRSRRSSSTGRSCPGARLSRP